MTSKPFMIHLPSERLLDLDINLLKATILKAKVTDIMLRQRSFTEQPLPHPSIRQFVRWCSVNSIHLWYCRWYWPGSGWFPDDWFNIFNSETYNSWYLRVKAEIARMYCPAFIVADIEPYMKENWANVFEAPKIPSSLTKAIQGAPLAHQLDGIIPVMDRPDHFSQGWKNWGTSQFRQEKRYINSPVFLGTVGPNDWCQCCVTSDGRKWSNSITWTPQQVAGVISNGEKILIYTDSNIPAEITAVLEGVADQWT